MHPQVKFLLEQTYFEQRSPEWFEQRQTCITASEAGTALGVNKYESRKSYILTKSGIKPARSFGNKYTQHGVDNEDMVREWYEKEYNQKVHETGMVPHPTLSFIGASPDGVCESGRLLEIKCPSGAKRIREEVGKMIPLAYLTQMQMQMECCDLDECDFVEYVAPQFSLDGEPHFYMTIVKRDPIWWEENLPKLKEVWDIVTSIREDPSKVNILYKNEVTLQEPVKCDIVYDENELDFF